MAGAYQQGLDLSAIKSSLIDSYCTVAVFALVVYDHIITASREFSLIWGRKVNIVVLLFHLNRWMILVWAFYNLLQDWISPSTISRCVASNNFGSAVDLILFALWAVFSAVRIYGVSVGSWTLTLIVFTLYMAPVGIDAWVSYRGYWYQVDYISGDGPVCVAGMRISVAENARAVIATRTCVMAADVIVLLITWAKTYSIKRESHRCGNRTPLTTLLLRDGTLYFIPLLGLNILNIVGQATNRFVYADVFFIPLSSVVVTHFILNLRQVIYDAPNGSTATQPSVLSFVDRQLDLQASDLRFASFVDNIGHMLEQDDNVPTPGLETDVEDRGRGYTPITDIHGVSERL